MRKSKIVESNKDQKFLKLEIPFYSELSLQDYSLLNEIFKEFKKNEFYFSLSDKQIDFFFNTIDVALVFEQMNVMKKGNASSELLRVFEAFLFKINSIKSYGIKSNKRVFIGYNKERKVKNRKLKELNRNQYFYAKNNDFSEINNSVPKKFENKIICGDSIKILKSIPDNCIDLVFTSPPYNFGLEYQSNKDDQYWDHYFKKLFEIFNECIRVLKYGGRIIVNIQPLFSDYIPSHHILSNYFMSKKLIWKGEILWEKNNYNCKYTAWGSWKSPSNPYLKYTWEYIEIFSKGTLKKEGVQKNADISGDEFKKWVVSKWSIAPERNMKQFDHPAMFPEELVNRVLKLFSFQNDIILDPFNGVGTTTLVARRTGRRYLGIDISKDYCEKAESRMSSLLF